jgi:cytidylate kinase
LIYAKYVLIVGDILFGKLRKRLHASVVQQGGLLMEKTVITISRQYGAGGRELAGIMAEKLGIKLYDRQIVHIAAAKLGIDDLSEEELLEMENHVKPLSMSFIPFHSFGTHMGSSSQEMFMSESAAIRKLAEDGPCIFLGRSADYALRKKDNVFSIFVCASDEFREARGQNVYGGKSLKELNKENEKRARYYDYYTGRTWGDGANYDLVVNTSHDSLESIAEGILAYIERVKK